MDFERIYFKDYPVNNLDFFYEYFFIDFQNYNHGFLKGFEKYFLRTFKVRPTIVDFERLYLKDYPVNNLGFFKNIFS